MEPTNNLDGQQIDLTPGQTSADLPPLESEFKLPDEYAGLPAFKDVNSMDELCKKVVNQESLIGKKYIGIPDEKSTQEEIAKYREAIGVPVKYEDYNIEASPEIRQAYGEDNPDVMNEFKQLMFNAGLSQKQALQMRQGYDKIVGGLVEQQKAQQQALNDEFEKLVTESFGNKKEEKMEIAQKFIQQNVSDNIKKYLPHVMQDNNSLLVLADIANNIYPQLNADDIRDYGGGAPSGVTEAEVRAKMQTIIASEAYQNSRHPGNDQAKKELLEQAKILEKIMKR